jgi:CheY-like chemotaxis protein
MELFNIALNDIIFNGSNGMQYILDSVVKETQSTYGLIAEKITGTLLRFHAVHGIANDSSYMRGFHEHGYVDFPQLNNLHSRILTDPTAGPFIHNDIPSHRKGCTFKADHPTIKTYCSVPIINNKNTIGVLSIGSSTTVYDINTLHMLEKYVDVISNLLILYRKIQDLEREKSIFMANTSIDLGNPLNGIISMTRLLKNSSLDDDQRKYTDVILKCGLQLLDSVNDIMDYSKIISGQLVLKPQICCIKNCINDVYEIMQERAHEKHLAITLDVDPNVPELQMIDNVRVTQILSNVISNAIKFTKKGSVKINVRREQNELLVKITDTGIGMTEDTLHKIFDHNVASHLGLGLAITKALVDLHHGTLKITSQVNKYTIVDILLPICACNAPIDLNQLKAFYKAYPVLIIDVNVHDRMRIFEIVGQLSNTPIMTNNLDDASTYLNRNNVFGYKMVIANVGGFNLADFNKLEMPQNVVVLLVADIESLSKINIRYDYHISYPFTAEQILATLNSICILHQSHATNIGIPIDILVADSIDGKQIITVLGSLGYFNIDTAQDGLDMYMKVLHNSYDICFVDLKLPIIDGLSVTRKIREASIATCIVALTTNISENVRSECFGAGMNGYITKPPNKSELEKIMNNVVMKKFSLATR